MAPEDDIKKRVSRKLTKRRKEGHHPTMAIPDRFRDGDDADEDCTAPQGANNILNQSVFGMIAAAGSQVDFNARFDGQSSDEEEDAGEPLSQSSGLQVKKTRQDKTTPQTPEKHRRKFSEHKLIRSLPRLGSRTKSKGPAKSDSPPETPSPSRRPEIDVSKLPSHTPVMSRMLEAKAEALMRPSFDLQRLTEDSDFSKSPEGQKASSLAIRLMEIFQFETAEDVIEGS